MKNVIGFLLCMFAGAVNAGLIIGADSVTATGTQYSWYLASDTINQSGLSQNYISGVTDFDIFTSTVTHSGAGIAANYIPTSYIYDLGAVFSIESFALWNRGYAGQGIDDFELYGSNDGFATEVLLGAFSTITTSGISNIVGAEVFGFDNIASVSSVRLDVLSTYHSQGLSTHGEVAFEVAEVPEPGALTLLALGLVGFAYSSKKKSLRS